MIAKKAKGPVWSDDEELDEDFLRLLDLGAPKSGKTVVTVGTCPQPSFVINCDQKGALRRVREFYPKARFLTMPKPVHSIEDGERASYTPARRSLNDGVQTVILDARSRASRRSSSSSARR